MEESIGKEVKILSNLLRRKTMCGDKSMPKMAVHHGRIIGYLYANADKDVFQKDIEKEFGIRRSTATSTLKKMEEAGLITRLSVGYDLRLKKLTLTEKAIKQHSGFSKRVDEIEGLIEGTLTAEEKTEFLRIIKKIQLSLE